MTAINTTQNATNDVEELEAIYKGVLNCESAIPPEELDLLADMVRDNEIVGRPWRLTALIASKDGAFFKELSESEEKAKALAPTVDALRAFSDRLQGMAKLADCAASRIMVAGCNHEDFIEWMKEPA